MRKPEFDVVCNQTAYEVQDAVVLLLTSFVSKEHVDVEEVERERSHHTPTQDRCIAVVILGTPPTRSGML